MLLPSFKRSSRDIMLSGPGPGLSDHHHHQAQGRHQEGSDRRGLYLGGQGCLCTFVAGRKGVMDFVTSHDETSIGRIHQKQKQSHRHISQYPLKATLTVMQPCNLWSPSNSRIVTKQVQSSSGLSPLQPGTELRTGLPARAQQ